MSGTMPASATIFKLAKLRQRTLRQVSRFHDYNFRAYFAQRTVDRFNVVVRQPDDEARRFLAGEGVEQLRQMRRMAALNATYSKTPVFLDPAIQPRVKPVAVAGLDNLAMPGAAVSSFESALPHQGPALSKMANEDPEDIESRGDDESHGAHKHH